MRDLVMVAVMIAAILVLTAYVAFCDRVVASGDDTANPSQRGVATPAPEEVAA